MKLFERVVNKRVNRYRTEWSVHILYVSTCILNDKLACTSMWSIFLHVFTNYRLRLAESRNADLRICTYKLCSRNCKKCMPTNLLHKIVRYCAVFNRGSNVPLIIVFKYQICCCVFIVKRSVNSDVILHTNHSDTIFMAIVFYETFL